MAKLNFQKLFFSCNNDAYCVVKLSPAFPEYRPGEDLDIFCRDLQAFSRKVISFLQEYVDEEHSIKVTKKGKNIKVDLLEGKKIYFRFDLIGAMPQYSRVEIKPSFFDIVIENAKVVIVDGLEIKTPSLGDECIIRYVEYIENFGIRPDKVKHTDFINEMFERSVVDPNELFQRLFYFTELPEPHYAKKSIKEKIYERFTLFGTIIDKALHLLREKGVRSLVEKIARRLGSK